MTVHSAGFINWEEVCSGWHNPQLFLSRSAAAQPIGFLPPTTEGYMKPKFIEKPPALTKRLGRKGAGVPCIIMSTDYSVIFHWVAGGFERRKRHAAFCFCNCCRFYEASPPMFVTLNNSSHKLPVCLHSSTDSEYSDMQANMKNECSRLQVIFNSIGWLGLKFSCKLFPTSSYFGDIPGKKKKRVLFSRLGNWKFFSIKEKQFS